MNMDYMSQFMGPGLGGIMAGTEQRQLEDKRYTDVQQTLQQIAASQGQEVRANEENARKAAMHPEELKGKQLANQKLTEEQKYTMLTRYTEQALTTGGLPGGAETLDQDFPQMKNHPIRKAIAEAQEKDKVRLPGATGPTEVEKLQQRISQMDPKSRDAAAAREHQAALAKAAQEAAEKKTLANTAAVTERMITLKMMDADMLRDKLAAELNKAEVQKKDPSLAQQAASLIRQYDQVRHDTSIPVEERTALLQRIQSQMTATEAAMTNPGVAKATALKPDVPAMTKGRVQVVPPAPPIDLSKGQPPLKQSGVVGTNETPIPQQAIDDFNADTSPNKVANFERIFGKGSAAKIPKK